MKQNKSEFITLSTSDLKKVEGGIFLILLGISIAYAGIATALCYNMGKDGKSGYSHEND